MRITRSAITFAGAMMLVSSGVHGQHIKTSDNPQSAELAAAADAALNQPDKLDVAIDDYETALLLDPQNQSALLGLARAAMKQNLPGKAIHYYRQFLAQAGDNITALEGQGEALVAKGALVKAEENLAKIKALCPAVCAEQTALNTAIEKAKSAPPAGAVGEATPASANPEAH